MTITTAESAGFSGEVDVPLVLGYGEGEHSSLTQEMVPCTIPSSCAASWW
jgi:hypothetical protein